MIMKFNALAGKLISLLLSLISVLSSLFYTATGCEHRSLFADCGFINGFTVMSQDAKPLGSFNYSSSVAEPSWTIAQWNSGKCLWADREDAGEYTITDGETKWVTYNPADSSVQMRLNAANIYKGQPANESAWPHLLLEQSPVPGYNDMSDEEKSFYSCAAKKLVLSLDIRIDSFSDTLNADGINAVQFLQYFYLKGIDTDDFIWFGVNLFDSRGNQDTYWGQDTAGSNNMIYTVSDRDAFGTAGISLFRNGRPYVSDEWLTVRLDLTPHIKKLIKRANENELYGRKISAEEFFISGTNIGFEIHGNYDCTVSIKNFGITSYN